MIDFLSTSPSMEPRAQRSAHLLAAVLSQAFQDLCIQPSDTEKTKQRNLNPHVIASFRFFYEDTDVFKVYAHMIGIDPKSLTDAIFKLTHEKAPLLGTKQKILDKDIRVLRMRMRWFRRQQDRIALVKLRISE